jgi:hypothetical protein
VSVKLARSLVYERSGGICEVCGKARGTNWHHRKNAGQGGLWAASNGLHLCGSGTTGCHGHITTHPAVSREQGWSVPSWGDPLTTRVWLAGRGFVFLRDDGSMRAAS